MCSVMQITLDLEPRRIFVIQIAAQLKCAGIALNLVATPANTDNRAKWTIRNKKLRIDLFRHIFFNNMTYDDLTDDLKN